MKNIIKIIVFATALTFTSCNCGCDTSGYKYIISDGNSSYYTNDYVIYSDHVSFLADKKIDSIIIGGNYTILKNSEFKPSKSKR